MGSGRYGTFFNTLENFLGGITIIFFYTGGYNSIERTRTSQLGHGVKTRHSLLCNRQCLYFNADAITNAEMPLPRFPNGLLSIYRGPPTLSNF